MIKVVYAVTLLLSASALFAQEKESGMPPSELPVKTAVSDVDQDNIEYSPKDIDVAPKYPDGEAVFVADIIKELKKAGAASSSTGKIYITFTVEKDGNLSKTQCIRVKDKALTEEIIKAVRKVCKTWSPGILKGKAVRTRMLLPIDLSY